MCINTGAIEYIDTGVTPCLPHSKPYTPPLKGLKMYDNDVLIHDYTPCVNPDGVEGAYDFVTETFVPTAEFKEIVLEFLRKADSVRLGG